MTKQHCALVVDRSGSMMGKEHDTVGGINTCIKELHSQKEDEDSIYVTLTWFDHEELSHWDNITIDSNPELNVTDFKPRGQTALLDAMGNCIQKYMSMKDEDPNAYDSCVIYVATDGEENASVKFNRDQIKALIQKAKSEYDILVIYMAANQDAILEAKTMGIDQTNSINYDENHESTQAVYRSAASVAFRVRTGQSGAFLEEERQASQPGNDFDSPTVPEWKQHMFLDAAKMHNWSCVYGLLSETPELINVVGGIAHRWTALHQAAAFNEKNVVKKLLDLGADKNMVNRDGKLPMNLATSADVIEILKV